MYFLLMAEVYYGMFEEPSKILFFVGLPNQMRIQSDWSQKIILPLDMINWLHVRFLHQAYYLTGSFCIEVSREQIPIWVEVKTWNLRWFENCVPTSPFDLKFSFGCCLLQNSHVSLPLLPLLSRWFSFLDMDWRADPLTKWTHFVVRSFRLSQFQPYFISRHHHCDLCFCWPWHWSKDYMKNTKPCQGESTKHATTTNLQHDSAQMAGKIIPVEGQRCFFQNTITLVQFFSNSNLAGGPVHRIPIFLIVLGQPKKYTEPPRRCQWGVNKKQLTFRPFVWCVASPLSLKLIFWGELDGQHIPTKLTFYISHWDIFHHNNHFAHEFGPSICYKKSRAPENWHGTQQLVFCRLCSFSKKPFQFPY